MKFIIRVREKGSPRSWTETYDYPHIKTEEAAQQWAVSTIEKFNASLRSDEVARELIDLTIVNQGEARPEHEWRKHNLVTIISDDPNGRSYDVYRCEVCKAMGKRYGLDPTITPDKGVSNYCQSEKEKPRD